MGCDDRARAQTAQMHTNYGCSDDGHTCQARERVSVVEKVATL